MIKHGVCAPVVCIFLDISKRGWEEECFGRTKGPR